ncbi:MAG: class I SAM-dependent methyltransferase, partial [Gemmatimonadales bacterium]
MGDSPAFPDHFSPVAAGYAAFRPTYPSALFDWIATQAPARTAVWDCACGNGQATGPLAERFDLVIATDGSAEQLSHAPPIPRTIWKHATAEANGLPDASVDAVVIAQALHWFDLDRFWPEVRRVVRPGGLVVAWCYGPTRLPDPALNAVVHSLYEDVLGEWWSANRRHIDAGYT